MKDISAVTFSSLGFEGGTYSVGLVFEVPEGLNSHMVASFCQERVISELCEEFERPFDDVDVSLVPDGSAWRVVVLRLTNEELSHVKDGAEKALRDEVRTPFREFPFEDTHSCVGDAMRLFRAEGEAAELGSSSHKGKASVRKHI